jgi:hypothetical protein
MIIYHRVVEIALSSPAGGASRETLRFGIIARL